MKFIEWITRRVILGIEDERRQLVEPLRMLWSCDECGCTEVQFDAWLDMNTNAIVSGGCGDGPVDQIFCPQCDGEVTASQKNGTVPKPATEVSR